VEAAEGPFAGAGEGEPGVGGLVAAGQREPGGEEFLDEVEAEVWTEADQRPEAGGEARGLGEGGQHGPPAVGGVAVGHQDQQRRQGASPGGAGQALLQEDQRRAERRVTPGDERWWLEVRRGGRSGALPLGLAGVGQGLDAHLEVGARGCPLSQVRQEFLEEKLQRRQGSPLHRSGGVAHEEHRLGAAFRGARQVHGRARIARTAPSIGRNGGATG
jgi:hypothetical protein